MASALVRKLQVLTYFRERGPAFSPTIHHVLPMERWDAMMNRRSFLHALPPLTFGCLWSMRVLPSLAAPPPPIRRAHREVGTTCPDGEAAAETGVASRATARSCPLEREERSKASTTAPLMQAEGGATWGAPENGPRGSGCLA